MSRFDRSSTSFNNFNSNIEFSRMMLLHSVLISFSISGCEMRISENPEIAFKGVRISWLMFERKTLLAWMLSFFLPETIVFLIQKPKMKVK